MSKVIYATWEDIPFTTTDNPGDNMLESLHGRQVDISEKLQYCMRVHVHDTALKGEPRNHEKLKHQTDGTKSCGAENQRLSFQSKKQIGREISFLGVPATGKARGIIKKT